MKNINNYINLSLCKERGVYKLVSRNLSLGIFTNNYFIGIREKFNTKYLSAEIHHDANGTAKPIELIEYTPSNLELKIFLGTYDKISGKEVKFDCPVSDGGKGWFFVENGLSSLDIIPIAKNNANLFNYLNKIQSNIII